MDIKEFTEALASALKIDAQEFADQLNDGGGELKPAEAAAKVAEIVRGRLAAAKKEQHARAMRETWGKVEKLVKANGFEAEDMQGETLLSAYIEAQASKPPVKGEMLTKEALSKMPEVQQLIAEGKQKAAQALTEIQQQHETFKRQVETERAKEVSRRIALAALEKEGVALAGDIKDVDAKERRLNAILLTVGQNVREENGKVFFVDAEGRIEEDDYGKPVDYAKRVIETGKMLFGTHVVTPGRAGANPQSGGANGTAGTGSKMSFATAEDFNKFYATETDAAKRFEGLQAYQQQQEQAAG